MAPHTRRPGPVRPSTAPSTGCAFLAPEPGPRPPVARGPGNGCATFGKPCREGDAIVWHSGAMRRHVLQALLELRPMIKTCWEVLLRAEPPASPLGNPDTLVFMMDGTLDAFFAALRSPAPRRRRAERGEKRVQRAVHHED